MKGDAARAESARIGRHILALIRTHFEEKEEAFYAAALQAAASEASQGNERLARQIRDLAETHRRKRSLFEDRGVAPTVPLAQPRGELQGLITASYPEARLSTLVIGDDLRDRLMRIIREQREVAKIAGYGLQPRRKILLVGPPGTGKTLTASVLATELRIPMFSVHLEAVVTKFLGETAQKLRLIFDSVAITRGLYFFDEFDALGGRRTDPNEVGEIRRGLSAFLKFVEEDRSQSLIVAATNHPGLLDRALFRRFDDILEYAPPNTEQVRQLVERAAAVLPLSIDWQDVLDRMRGFTQADVVNTTEDAVKDALMNQTEQLSTVTMDSAIERRRRSFQA